MKNLPLWRYCTTAQYKEMLLSWELLDRSINVEKIEDDLFITFKHQMAREHFISFAANVSFDKVVLARLYPEQGSEVRLPDIYGGKLYFYCIQHGLWVNK